MTSHSLACQVARSTWHLNQSLTSTLPHSLTLSAGSLQGFTTNVAHVLPVSDDGGSTAEIVRVLGGPAVGDIRSRCLRLADDSNVEVNILHEIHNRQLHLSSSKR